MTMRRFHNAVKWCVPKGVHNQITLLKGEETKTIIYAGKRYMYVIYLDDRVGAYDKVWRVVHGYWMRIFHNLTKDPKYRYKEQDVADVIMQNEQPTYLIRPQQ